MGGSGSQGQKVFPNLLRHAHKAAAALKEPAGEGLVEPVGFVRNYVVQHHHALAAGFAGYIPKGGGEPRHPVFHDQKVRLPLPDGPGRADPGKGVHRVQQGFRLHGGGFVFRRYVLCFARKKKAGILPGEREGTGIMTFSQSFQHAGVELGNATAQRIKTGQQGDSHLTWRCFPWS